MVVISFCSLGVFAQSTTGELDRFKNESLIQANEVQLFPNPSVDVLNIKIDNFNLEGVKIVVHNIIGNIQEVDVEEVGVGQYQIRVKDLNPGYYLVSIRDEKNIFRQTQKVLVRQ